MSKDNTGYRNLPLTHLQLYSASKLKLVGGQAGVSLGEAQTTTNVAGVDVDDDGDDDDDDSHIKE